MKTPVVFSSCQVRLPCKVPHLNSPGIVRFGGETGKLKFPLFVYNFATKIGEFVNHLKRKYAVWSKIEWTSPLLPNDILLKSATRLETNHKMKDKPQTWICFLGEKPNQNKGKWTLPLFENVKGKSSPKWTNPKILKNWTLLFLIWETLVGGMQQRRCRSPCTDH